MVSALPVASRLAHFKAVVKIEEVNYLSYFVTQGPFAALFVWLLWQTQKRNKEREDSMMKENRAREERLYNTLDEFAQRYDIVIVKLDEIKSKLR